MPSPTAPIPPAASSRRCSSPTAEPVRAAAHLDRLGPLPARSSARTSPPSCPPRSAPPPRPLDLGRMRIDLFPEGTAPPHPALRDHRRADRPGDLLSRPRARRRRPHSPPPRLGRRPQVGRPRLARGARGRARRGSAIDPHHRRRGAGGGPRQRLRRHRRRPRDPARRRPHPPRHRPRRDPRAGRRPRHPRRRAPPPPRRPAKRPTTSSSPHPCAGSAPSAPSTATP